MIILLIIFVSVIATIITIYAIFKISQSHIKYGCPVCWSDQLFFLSNTESKDAKIQCKHCDTYIGYSCGQLVKVDK